MEPKRVLLWGLPKNPFGTLLSKNVLLVTHIMKDSLCILLGLKGNKAISVGWTQTQGSVPGLHFHCHTLINIIAGVIQSAGQNIYSLTELTLLTPQHGQSLSSPPSLLHAGRRSVSGRSHWSTHKNNTPISWSSNMQQQQQQKGQVRLQTQNQEAL